MASSRAWILGVWLAVAAAWAAGCTDIGGLSISAEDQIAQPGRTIRVVARIHRKGMSRWFAPTNPPPVRIYRNNELLEEFHPVIGTDEVAADVTLDSPGEHVIDALYQRRANHKPEQATCYAYCWDASRVAIAVDLDQVVNRISRFDKMAQETPLGEPRDEAPAVLAGLAREFYLCYLTELASGQKEAIRAWLRKNNLPTGPIFTWDRGNRYRLNPGNQATVLERLRERVPTLLIGIGDGEDDLAAFARNRMLAVMIEYRGPLHAPLDVPRCSGWREAWQFFSLEANHPILTDPRTMLDLYYRGGGYVGAPNNPPPGPNAQ